jgi:hypothetical protein
MNTVILTSMDLLTVVKSMTVLLWLKIHTELNSVQVTEMLIVQIVQFISFLVMVLGIVSISSISPMNSIWLTIPMVILKSILVTKLIKIT